MWTENVVVGSTVIPGLCACTRVEFVSSGLKGEPGMDRVGRCPPSFSLFAPPPSRVREGQSGRDTASGSLLGLAHFSQCYMAGLLYHYGSTVGPNV